MRIKTFHELFVHEIRDLYDAEKQILKALPKMEKAATHPDLKRGFKEHLAQTQMHVDRLEQVFKLLGENVRGVKCAGMQGLIEEGDSIVKDKDMPEEVRDAALIGAAQRVEHYEMAAYGTVRTFAEVMGHERAAELLQQTLDEEGETDHKLSGLAIRIVNPEAMEEASGMEEYDKEESSVLTGR